MSTKSSVIATRSGVFVRTGDPGATFVFSPYTGLLFALRNAESVAVVKWLKSPRSLAPATEYRDALGPGWAVPAKAGTYPKRHLLPCDDTQWPELRPDRPLLINWFLTGNCQLDCDYCYAKDLMNGACAEPDAARITELASVILAYEPLAVVLTGGDPSASPHLERAMKALRGKAGIIVDTNGYCLTPGQVSLFRQYGAFVRISLDSEVPAVNQRLRPLSRGTGNATSLSTAAAAVRSLCMCIQAGVPVGVQTVVGKRNQGDLESLFDKLSRMGVASWRVMLEAPTIRTQSSSRKNSRPKSDSSRFRNHILAELRSKQVRGCDHVMSLQFTDNSTANAVVLVSPDGQFFTESSIHPGKLVIDPRSPNRPSRHAILSQVDMHAHARRYLNL